MAMVRLCGGLGNQMFQYAAVLNLAQRNHSIPKVDVSWFSLNHQAIGCTPRLYELDQFVGVKVAKVYFPKIYSRTIGLLHRYPILRKNSLISRKFFLEEASFRYDLRFEKLSYDSVLDGYFQSIQYLAPVASELRRSLVPICQTDELFQSILEMTSFENTVAVHVRRGDYVSLLAANKFHGILDLNYYRNALSLINRKVNNASFLFFSDDLNWCREAFYDLERSQFVETRHLTSAQVLYLMSRCNHQIIANSSFSWWAGWLNPKSDKSVVMPKMWTKEKTIQDTGLIFNSCIIV